MEADSLQSTELYLKLTAWLHANRKALMIVATVAVVIAAVVGIMAWEKSQTEAAADADLMNVPLATIHEGRMVPAPASALLDVAKQYPDTSAGEYGALLGAETLFVDGKYPEAHEGFSKFIEDHPDSPLIAQAKVGVAACLEGEGKIQEAAQKYQEIIMTYPGDPNISSPAKLTLARLDEQLNKPEQAFQYYADLARVNVPFDPWAPEARERGELLLLKHPELAKPPPGSSGGLPSSSPSPGFKISPPGQKPSAPAQAPASAKP